MLGLALAAAAQIPFLSHHKAADFRIYGKMTVFHLNEPLDAPAPVSLTKFPLNNFTYTLYPTAPSGADGMVPGNTITGVPTQIEVARGIYDDHVTNRVNPMEFQVIKDELVHLPKAPGGRALLVYTVLYTGRRLQNCTGIVQMLERKQGKLNLADQFSYDCTGGAGANWNPKKRQLELRSADFVPGDKPCCPTLYDHVIFQLDGDSVQTKSVELNPR